MMCLLFILHAKKNNSSMILLYTIIDNVYKSLPRCDVVQHPCDPNPCQNGAECKSWGAVRKQCICKPGYTGVNCSVNIGKDYISPNFRHNILFIPLKIYFLVCLSLFMHILFCTLLRMSFFAW